MPDFEYEDARVSKKKHKNLGAPPLPVELLKNKQIKMINKTAVHK
jgi:hypothetical protein